MSYPLTLYSKSCVPLWYESFLSCYIIHSNHFYALIQKQFLGDVGYPLSLDIRRFILCALLNQRILIVLQYLRHQSYHLIVMKNFLKLNAQYW